MRQLLDGVWTWSVFDTARQVDFNGYHVTIGDWRALIDPVPFDEAAIERLGAPTEVIITNKDHRRASRRARERWGAKVLIHERDAPLLDDEEGGEPREEPVVPTGGPGGVGTGGDERRLATRGVGLGRVVDGPVDGTFQDGDLLGGALQVVHLVDQKSPGECALLWKDRRVLFLGDALWGKPAGQLTMLPDPAAARAGLQRLADLDPEAILMGDGAPILSSAAEVLRRTLARLRG
jgi:glyoxylase-like metal-dependent hydrolase (beta-lactamase superfamily II)